LKGEVGNLEGEVGELKRTSVYQNLDTIVSVKVFLKYR